MTLGKAMLWGVVTAVAVSAALLVVGFIFRINVQIPGFITVASAAEGTPQTEFLFNPLAPILLALLVGVALWGVGRLRSRSDGQR